MGETAKNKGFWHAGCCWNPLFAFGVVPGQHGSGGCEQPPLNVIEEAAQIRLKKSRCFSIMEAWQRQESDRMSAIHEKGGRCH